MMCFRHIELSFILIDKDVKIGEKFHERQLFDRGFPELLRAMVLRGKAHFAWVFCVRAGGFEKTVFFLISL